MAIRMTDGLKNALLDTGSAKDLFEKGFIELYSGSQPASANTSESSYTRRMIIGTRLTAASHTLAFATTTTFTLAGDQEALFTALDNIFCLLGTTVIEAEVVSAVFAVDTTTVTITASTDLTSALSEVIIGVNWEAAAASGELDKLSTETWQGKGLSDGSVGWWRLYANALDRGADGSGDKVRLDGNIGSSGDIQAVSTTIQTSAVSTLDTFKLKFPTT